MTNSLGMKFMLIPAGKFTMGSSQEEIDRCLKLVGNNRSDMDRLLTEGPEHEVEITQPFYLGATEVTVGQFRRFVEANPKYQVGDDEWKNPGFEQTDDHPVVSVIWTNAVDFCTWMSQKEGEKYRLPTEAEWEYSCRAGTKTRYSCGDRDTDLLLYAWSRTHLQGWTHPVGRLKRNPWGLFDMHGNVREWCQDVYDPKYYESSSKKDPPGPSTRGGRVNRGGSWDSSPVHCRSAFRFHGIPHYRDKHVGFRVLLVPSSSGGVRP